MAVIGEGRAEVLELEVRFRDRRSQRVKSLGLPRGALIGAIVRDQEVIVPGRETTVEDGDHVIVIALASEVRAVEDLFRGPRDNETRA